MGNWFEKARLLRQATIEIFRESTDIVIASMTKDHVTTRVAFTYCIRPACRFDKTVTTCKNLLAQTSAVSVEQQGERWQLC